MTEITEFATREAMMQAAASRLAEALNQALGKRCEACAALSGGGTPEPAYRALAAMPIDWPKVTFLLVDERFLPTLDGASNEGMLHRALAPALKDGAQLLPLFMPYAPPDEAARSAEAAYAAKHIDIAVMGMGGDGHTASWFSQSPELSAALDLKNPRTVIAVNAPGAPGSEQRLTLTRSALAKAARTLLLIAGEEKRTLLEAERARLPIDALLELPAPAEILWAP